MSKKRIDLNVDRCVGCFACVVACLDQNSNTDSTSPSFRRTVKMENEESGIIRYISIGCMHCEDNPCIFACPTGAIYKDKETDMVQVDSSKCIGCHSCALACPFGAPKFDEQNKMSKCDGCNERVKKGLLPACVKVCPSKAMQFITEEEATLQKNHRLREIILKTTV